MADEKEKRKFAFDWGSCLEGNESLRQIARELFKLDYEVHVVPACGKGAVFPYPVALSNANIPYHGLHLVLHDENHSPESSAGAAWIAAEKVAVLKKLGVSVLYDDNPTNVAAAQAAGITAVRVRPGEAVERPPELPPPPPLEEAPQ